MSGDVWETSHYFDNETARTLNMAFYGGPLQTERYVVEMAGSISFCFPLAGLVHGGKVCTTEDGCYYLDSISKHPKKPIYLAQYVFCK